MGEVSIDLLTTRLLSYRAESLPLGRPVPAAMCSQQELRRRDRQNLGDWSLPREQRQPCRRNPDGW